MEISEWMTTFGCAITTSKICLGSENAYTSTMMRKRCKLLSIRNARRIKETDLCAIRKDDYYYYSRTEEETQFTVANKAVSTPQRKYY